MLSKEDLLRAKMDQQNQAAAVAHAMRNKVESINLTAAANTYAALVAKHAPDSFDSHMELARQAVDSAPFLAAALGLIELKPKDAPEPDTPKNGGAVIIGGE